ncbi:MAG TPA: hypothetical protein VHU88_07655 [Sporichthyaceae bacterium]|jgi:hypothetical protein|nr:hypothetical protein [Sporichthyaceae bacterium]
MEPFDHYGMPQERPAEESPMNGQSSLPFYSALPSVDPAGPAPAKRGFARLGKPRRTVVAGVTVAALAATGGVALAAANSNPTPTPGTPGAAAMMHGRGGPVHGTFTVSDGKGGYETELMQRGTVASFSGGTLTVKSADGYTHSYSTDSTTMFGRGGHGGHGMRGGNWGRGPMHGRFGTMPNGTAMPNGAAMPNTAMPNTAVPNSATATTPNLTVGENVMVIAIQSGGTDHAQRVMPMRTPNQNGQQNNGQNGNGGFFGRHRGSGGMTGGQMGGAPMGNAPMGNGQPGNGPTGMGPGRLGNGPVNLPNGAPATSSSPATTPQSSAGATAQSTGPAATTNG